MAKKTIAPQDTRSSEMRSMVLQKFHGIVPMYEAFYLHAIDYSATAAVSAIERFAYERDVFFAPENHNSPVNQEQVVSAVHEALTHCAGLSKLFWSPAKDALAQSRSERLRSAYGLDEKSPLNNRSLRNSLEHFDERLDEFLLSGPVGTMFPGSLVQPHTIADDPLGKIFRLVDPVALVFVIFNKKYDFKAIFDEAFSVAERTTELLNSGSTFRTLVKEPTTQTG